MPERIQLRRTKGWKMPPNTVKVDRTTEFGNPFIVNPHVKPGSRSGSTYVCVPTLEDAISCFRIFANEQEDFKEKVKQQLKGKNLACWCPLPEHPETRDRCHAAVLLEIANA